MHCPACNAEYREGFDTCADCSVPLLHGPPPRLAEPSHEMAWAPLCTISLETEAQLIQGMLETAGVPCEIESLKFHAEPVNFGGLSRVRIHVPEGKLGEARKLLADHDSDFA